MGFCKGVIAGLLVLSGIFVVRVFAAEDTGYDLGAVMVTPTRTPRQQASIGSAATLISREELARRGPARVADVLKETVGVTVTSSGVFGGETSVNIRGGRSGQTLVMIDGVEVYDPISISRSLDFAHLTTDNVERIEIVRGPQSVLYGSNAVTGVINIITRRGGGPAGMAIELEAGSHSSFRESIGISGSREDSDFSLQASHFETEGVSKIRDTSENDAYENTVFSGRYGRALGDCADFSLSLRRNYADFEIDDGFPLKDDPNHRIESEMFISRAELAIQTAERWDQSLAVSFLTMDRKDVDPPDSVDTLEDDYSRFRGDKKELEWLNNFSVFDSDLETIGLEYQEERGSSFSDSVLFSSRFDRKQAQTRAVFLQSQLMPAPELSLTAGVRAEDHDRFGTETTWSASLSRLWPARNLRLRANYATSFKAPSLYQLYSSFGNEALEAEKSRGYDVGLEQQWLDSQLTVSLAYFNNQFRNLIDWVSTGLWTGQYQNFGKAETDGWEARLVCQLKENLETGVNYTYTQTRDLSTGDEFGRRPENEAAVYVNWQPDPWSFSLLAAYVGSRWDDNANLTRLKHYYRVDARVARRIAEAVSIFGRIENLFDREYETVRGYAGLEQSLYAGIKAEF